MKTLLRSLTDYLLGPRCECPGCPNRAAGFAVEIYHTRGERLRGHGPAAFFPSGDVFSPPRPMCRTHLDEFHDQHPTRAR